MTTYSRPGVFISEVAIPQTVPSANNGTARGAFTGTFEKGPSIEPVLINSWYEFTKTFGTLSSTYPATIALYTFFANGGRQVYVKRVLGTGALPSTATLKDRAGTPLDTLTIEAANEGTWGDDLSVEIKSASTSTFNLIISDSNGILEQFTDLSMTTTNSRYVVSYVNSASSYVRVIDENNATSGTDKQPAVAVTALTSGANGAAPTRTQFNNALSTFDSINSPLIMNNADAAYTFASGGDEGVELPLMINLQADIAGYCEARGDAFAIVDIPSGYTQSEASNYILDLVADPDFSAAGSGGNSAAYWPWIVIPDNLSSASGATRLVPPGPAAIGQYLANDASRGVFKTPAGFGTRIANAVAVERNLTNAELDAINGQQNPINAIRNVPGAGIVIMGGRTLNNTPGDRYINVRRSLIFLKKELTDRSNFAVFENNDARLQNQLRTALGNFLRSYWSQGGLRGNTPGEAFFVRCDASNNSAADRENGRVNIEIGVALEYPAEFIVISIGQVTGSATA
jgi:phage tail sheath protein FI